MKKKQRKEFKKDEDSNRKQKEKPRQTSFSAISERQKEESEEKYRLHSSKHYFGYLKKYVKGSDPYRLYKKATEYFRPVRYLVRFFRWFVIALTWIQASALLLLAAAVILVIIPFALLALVISSVVIRVDAWEKLKSDKKEFEGKRIVVCFCSGEISRFFLSNALDLSHEYTVIIVGGAVKKSYTIRAKRFANRQKLADSLYVFREHYFFFVKNKVLNNCERVFFIY